MKLTIDTSVALKLIIDEPGSDKALALVESDATLIAPDLIHAEVANALWANVLSKRISRDAATRLLDEWQPLLDEFHETSELSREALQLAFEVEQAIYDCYFLALARREDALLVTADARFMKAIDKSAYRDHARLL